MSRPECLSCSISEGQQECFFYFPENGDQNCGLKMGVTIDLLKSMCTKRYKSPYNKELSPVCLIDYEECSIKSLEKFCTNCLGGYHRESVLHVAQNISDCLKTKRELVVAGR